MTVGGERIRYGEAVDRALSLWVVIHRAYAALQRAAAADIRARGFNPTEWGVLEYLYHKGTQPLAQVGREILITSGSVTYVIDKLETRGLIRRIPCPHDRRVVYAALTEKGRELMAREFPGHAAVIERLMSPLDAGEQELLKSLMKRIGLSAAGIANPQETSKIDRAMEGLTMAQKWVVDPTHTNVEFAVKHMMIATVRGRFSKVEGVIEGDPSDLTTARFEAAIDAASIDTRQEDRDNHLRSADFFDVANHPKITFKSTKVEKVGENQYKVTGDLTIRGVTRSVTLDTTYEGRGKDPWGGERIALSATGKINRKDFGLTWNAALETGGVLVSDEVKLEINVEAVLQA